MKKLTFFLLFAIVLLGGLLRFVDITNDPPGLYLDEVSIGLNAYDILKTGHDQYGAFMPLAFKSFGDYKMPGYIYLVSGAMSIFGKNEFAIRFPSAFFGTLTLIVVFFLVQSLLKGKIPKNHPDTVALVATLVLAITPWHIHFSRGGFEVTVAVFLYLLGMLFAVWFWQKKHFSYLVGTAILFLLSMYTYQTFRVLVPLTLLTAIGLAFLNKPRRHQLLIGVGILVLLSLPLIIFSLSAHGQSRFFQTSAFGQNPYHRGVQVFLGDAIIYVQNYLSFFSITYLFRLGDQINRHQVNNMGILYIWQLPFVVMGLYFLSKVKNTALRFVTLFLLLVGPMPAALVLPSPHTLRFLIGSIPYAFLSAFGLYQVFLQKGKWAKYLLVGVAIFAVIELGYYLDYYYLHYTREALIDWGGACKAVTKEIQKDAHNYQHIVIDKNLDCVPETFAFYMPQIPVTIVANGWSKPTSWGKTLFVRTYYGNPSPKGLVTNIYLSNINKDIFSQFYNL